MPDRPEPRASCSHGTQDQKKLLRTDSSVGRQSSTRCDMPHRAFARSRRLPRGRPHHPAAPWVPKTHRRTVDTVAETKNRSRPKRALGWGPGIPAGPWPVLLIRIHATASRSFRCGAKTANPGPRPASARGALGYGRSSISPQGDRRGRADELTSRDTPSILPPPTRNSSIW
jgi:hypothetical protein